MSGYYQPEQLKKFAEIGEGNAELAEKFFAYYGAVFQEGALTGREKAIIALGRGARGTVSLLHRC